MNKVLPTVIFGAVLTALLSTSASAVEKMPSGEVVKGNTEFALDIYGKIKEQEGNLFLSPYSISTAFAMTYAGAKGETEKQMAEAMRFTLPQNKLHELFSIIQGDLNKVQQNGNVKLAVANSLWPHRKYPFREDYMGVLKKNYGTSVTALDYVKETEKSRKRINEWVEDKTNDKIKELLKPGVLNSMTRLVLVSAIYFKGNWDSQFKKNSTSEASFKITADKTVKVPMMYQKQTFGYYADKELQVLEMPYVGKELSMIVLLPAEVDGIGALEKKLSVENLNKWTGKLRKRKVDIWIPKFKMTSEFSLNKTLAAMGMKDAFGKAADFSGMDGSKLLYISEAIHKAFVEVNEEGTEAAAATAVVMMSRSRPMSIRFRADHPFMFLIRDNKTKSILFMGRMNNPMK